MDQNDFDAVQHGQGDPPDGNDAEARTEADLDAALRAAGATDALSDAAGLEEADVDALLRATDESDSATDKDPELDAEGRPTDAYAAAMAAAIADEQASGASPALLAGDELSLPNLADDEPSTLVNQPLSLLHDVNLHVRIELGRTQMFVEDILRLGEGSLVELDRLAGDPVDVYVNDRLVARGEVLVLSDNFCVRVNEIIADEAAAVTMA